MVGFHKVVGGRWRGAASQRVPAPSSNLVTESEPLKNFLTCTRTC